MQKRCSSMTLSHSFVPLPIGRADTNLVLKRWKSPLLTPIELDARGLIQILARYRAPSPMRSIVELVMTAGPLILLWFLMWATLDLGYWLCLLLAVPAAGFLVRLFMIQHDCGHGAFFHRRFANDWVPSLPSASCALAAVKGSALNSFPAIAL